MKAKRKFKDYALKHAKIRKDKKVKGFTLVELIIVIAIIGILAAILIPTMTGKVKDAKIKTANDGAAKIAEQAAIIITDFEADGGSVSDGTYYCDGSTLTKTASTFTVEEKADPVGTLKTYIDKNVPSAQKSKWAIIIDKGSVTKSVFIAENGYVGIYPAIKSTKDGLTYKSSDDSDSKLTYYLTLSN